MNYSDFPIAFTVRDAASRTGAQQRMTAMKYARRVARRSIHPGSDPDETQFAMSLGEIDEHCFLNQLEATILSRKEGFEAAARIVACRSDLPRRHLMLAAGYLTQFAPAEVHAAVQAQQDLLQARMDRGMASVQRTLQNLGA